MKADWGIGHVQHTLRHLSRLSNTLLTEDACAGLAAGGTGTGKSDAEVAPMEEQPSEAALQGAQHEEAAAVSADVVVVQLPRLNLASPRRRQSPPGAATCKSLRSSHAHLQLFRSSHAYALLSYLHISAHAVLLPCG